MKKTVLLYGTTNPAKLAHMRGMLAPLPIEIVGAGDIGVRLPAVAETGSSPLANARLKALAYYTALGRPVFACDSALTIDGLPGAEQPGVHVRTIQGKALSDDAMIAYYASVAKRLGGKAVARFRNAICLITAADTRYERCGWDISGEAFFLASQPHQTRVAGYPLDCLSVRMDNGRYYYDDPKPGGRDTRQSEGFRAFFRKALQIAEG